MTTSAPWAFSFEGISEDFVAFLKWFRDGPRIETDLPDGVPVRYVHKGCPDIVQQFIEASLGFDSCRSDSRGRCYKVEDLQNLYDMTYSSVETAARTLQREESLKIDKRLLESRRARRHRAPAGTYSWKLCDPDAVDRLLSAADDRSRERKDCLRACLDASTRLLPVARDRHIHALEVLAEQFPNFRPVIDIYVPEIVLQARLREPLHLPTILMQGPPGIGKTAFAMALAESLRFSMQMRTFAELSAGFLITGSSETWSGGRPGLIADHCARSPNNTAPLVVIDEIDKSGERNYPPDRALLSVLEQNTAKNFRDENLGLEMDVRPISWIFTSNRLDQIKAELKSRMIIVEVQAPSREQMPAIVRSIDKAIRMQRPRLAKAFQPLDDSAIDALAVLPPRQLQRLLMQTYATAALAKSKGRIVTVSADDVRKVVGHAPPPLVPENKSRPAPIYMVPSGWVRLH